MPNQHRPITSSTMAVPITAQDLLNTLNNLAGLVTTLTGQQQTMQTAITNMANHLANFQAGPSPIRNITAPQITIPANISSAKIVENPTKYDEKDLEKARQSVTHSWSGYRTTCQHSVYAMPLVSPYSTPRIISRLILPKPSLLSSRL